MGELLQGVPKKVGFTATITSSKSHFFFGTPCSYSIKSLRQDIGLNGFECSTQ